MLEANTADELLMLTHGALGVLGCSREQHSAPAVRPHPPAVHSAAVTQAVRKGAPVRCPEGYVRMTVHGLFEDVVLLMDPDHQKVVPIAVADAEALSIRLRLAKRPFVRPLTHDLMDSVLARLGDRVESVRVERVEDDSFVATVVIDDHGKRLEFDARSSDAIALALGNDAPIFVAKKVLEQAGHALDQLLPDDRAPARSQPIAL